MPSISPDGKMILGTYSMGSTNRVVVMPWEGGPLRMLFDIERPKVHWSPDGKNLLYVETKDGVVRTHPGLTVPGEKGGTLDGFFIARFRRR